ncbi:zinc finger, CCHC-type containing protein [Tanacetum coccineum]
MRVCEDYNYLKAPTLTSHSITRVLFILPRNKFNPVSGDKSLDLSAFKLSRLFFSLLSSGSFSCWRSYGAYHLRIEESLRVKDNDKPKDNNVAGPSVVNMMKYNNSSRYNDNKDKRKHRDTKVDPNKKSKRTYWKCGKPGHLKRDCKGGKANGLGTNGSVNGSTNSLKGQNMFNKSLLVYYVTYVSEAYFVQDDDVAWWVDSGVIVYVCKDRSWFKTYESLNDGSILHMGNKSTTQLQGRGCVDLRFNSGKIVSLFDVLHVLNIKKNLVSSSLVLLMIILLQPLCQFLNCDNCALSRAVVRLPDPKLKTLGERGIKCIFVGYDMHSKAFRFSSVPRPSLMIPNGSEDIGGSVVAKEVTEELKEQGMRSLTNTPIALMLRMIPKHLMKQLSSKMLQTSWLKMDFYKKIEVARISIIRLLIAMTSIYNPIIHQMDVKTTFLNGELDEAVYMNQPQGFIMPGNENKVDLTKEVLSLRFSMKDMREADVILGIRIKHESNEATISQSHYIEKVLKKFNYFDYTPVSTPMDTSEKLMPNNVQAVSQLEYSRVIGCLMYIMTCTWPDIRGGSTFSEA